MATNIDQKEYLKKYLSLGSSKDKKEKKKKKKKSSKLKGMSIIEEDSNFQEIPFGYFEEDDAPTIAEITYEDKKLKDIEEFNIIKNKWKNIDEPITETSSKGPRHDSESPKLKEKYDSESDKKNVSEISYYQKHYSADTKAISHGKSKYDSNPLSPTNKRSNPNASLSRRQRHDSDESVPIKRKHDSDNSPPRSQRTDSDESLPKRRRHDSNDPPPRRQKLDSSKSPPRRQRHDSDESPPRRKEQDSDESSLRKRRHDSDESPPRKHKHDSNKSPPRRQRHHLDESPPRNQKKISRTSHSRRQRHDLDSSSLKRQKNGSDLYPPKKRSNDSDEPPTRRRNDLNAFTHPRRKRYESSTSPPRNRRHDSDTEPPRNRRHDSNASPPRRRRHDSGTSPPRKQRHDSDTSPPRKGGRHDSDTSPPRKQRHDLDTSPPRKGGRNDSDTSPPRRRRHDSDTSPPRRRKNYSDTSPPRKGEPRIRPERSMTTAEYLKARKFGKLKKDTPEELERKKRESELQQQAEAAHKSWNKGLVQVKARETKIKDDVHEMGKSLARYADDADMNERLKATSYDQLDPMFDYIRQKEQQKVGNKPQLPIYKGQWEPNRFKIRPGYRWDGVDRSNGFEKSWFSQVSAKKAIEEDAYKWSTDDM